MRVALHTCAVLLAACAVVPAQEPGDLFANVVDTLVRRYPDRDFRRDVLPDLERKFRPAAERATSLAEECGIVDGLLSHIPSSHLALYSQDTFDAMIAELAGRPYQTFGFQVEQRASRFFACKILENGPAARAGLRRGDRVLRIDGGVPQRSPRLDRRSDDAYLPDAPLHAVLVRPPADHDPDEDAPDRIRLVVARRPGGRLEFDVEARKYSALQAARTSARVIERNGRRIGYVHFWYIHSGCVALLRKLARKEFAACDALVLDLCGRGGNGVEARRIVEFFTGEKRGWTRPFVALLDKESRSAKEMLGYEFKKRKAALLFGEKTAGALVPAQFARVGQGMVLMFPGGRLPGYSDAVELSGVVPDVPVAYPLPFTAGADPILARALAHLAGEAAAAAGGAQRR